MTIFQMAGVAAVSMWLIMNTIFVIDRQLPLMSIPASLAAMAVAAQILHQAGFL